LNAACQQHPDIAVPQANFTASFFVDSCVEWLAHQPEGVNDTADWNYIDEIGMSQLPLNGHAQSRVENGFAGKILKLGN